jgi:hypothetical protein
MLSDVFHIAELAYRLFGVGCKDGLADTYGLIFVDKQAQQDV